MTDGWVAARDVFMLDQKGNAVIEWAAQELVSSRCVKTVGVEIQAGEDGYVALPARFWEGMKRRTGSAYRDWAAGNFTSEFRGSRFRDTPQSILAIKVEFALRELDRMSDGRMSKLLAAQKPKEFTVAEEVPVAKSTRGRRRKSEWNDWVAAVAIVANDGNVNGSLTETDLFELVSNKLAEWGLEEQPRSTVQPAMQAILKRLREDGL